MTDESLTAKTVLNTKETRLVCKHHNSNCVIWGHRARVKGYLMWKYLTQRLCITGMNTYLVWIKITGKVKISCADI